MMHVLLESGAHPRKRSARWTFTSVAVHAALVTLAIVATSEATTPGYLEPVPRDTIVYVVPRQETPRMPTTPNSVAGGAIAMPQQPRITVPTDVALPSIPTFDASRRFSNDIATLHLGPGLNATDSPAGGAANGLHTAASVDRAVLANPANPRPDYPQSLRAAAVEGDVIVTFVVDSTGRVEAGSVTILQATHEQFAEAVRRWLPRTRYRPAEVAGVRVRQYVQQQVGFALETKP